VLGTAIALQHWRPDRVDEGVCGGVSGLWRWKLALGRLEIFLEALQNC
jgi:phage shock protein PspC (stress-responsive transcriptional regulator)